MTGTQKEIKEIVFSFFKTALIMPKAPLFFGYKISMFYFVLFHCFLFLGSFSIGTGCPLLLRTCLFLWTTSFYLVGNKFESAFSSITNKFERHLLIKYKQVREAPSHLVQTSSRGAFPSSTNKFERCLLINYNQVREASSHQVQTSSRGAFSSITNKFEGRLLIKYKQVREAPSRQVQTSSKVFSSSTNKFESLLIKYKQVREAPSHQVQTSSRTF